MKILNASLAVLAAAGLAFASAGCTNQTEGDRTIAKSQRLEDAGLRMKEGEQMVRDGAAKEAAGRKAKEQGDITGGDRMIAEGAAEQREGRAKIDAAKKMRDGM